MQIIFRLTMLFIILGNNKEIAAQWIFVPAPLEAATFDPQGKPWCGAGYGPTEIIPFGNARYIYTTLCAYTGNSGYWGRICISNDDLKTSVVKTTGAPKYGNKGFTSLRHHNDSTFSWFDIIQGLPYAFFTCNDFKTVTDTKIKGDLYAPTADVTPHYFYSLLSNSLSDFYLSRTNINSGITTYIKTSGYYHKYYRLKFVNDSLGYSVMAADANSNVKILIRTTDYGSTWMPVFTDSSEEFTDFYLGQNSLYILKKNGQILYSSDLGATWSLKSIATSSNCTCIDIQNSSSWLIGAQHGVLLKTIDGGITWASELSNTTEDIQRIYTFDSEAYFVTKGKKVFKAQFPLDITEETPSLEVNVFPNPTNSMLRLRLPTHLVSKKTPLFIVVYDMLGKIKTEKVVDSTEPEFSIREFPAGVYIVKIKCGEMIQVLKIYKVD